MDFSAIIETIMGLFEGVDFEAIMTTVVEFLSGLFA